MSNPYLNIQQLISAYDVRTMFQLSNDQNLSTEQVATLQFRIDLAAGEFESKIGGYVPLPLPTVLNQVTDGAMVSGSTTLTTASSNPFNWNDIGKQITVGTSSGYTLQTTISAFVTPGNVTLAAANSSGGNISGCVVSYPVIPLICTWWVAVKAVEGMFARRNDRPKQVVDDASKADQWMEDFRMRKVSIPGVGRNEAQLIASGRVDGSTIYDHIFGLPRQRWIQGQSNPPNCGW